MTLGLTSLVLLVVINSLEESSLELKLGDNQREAFQVGVYQTSVLRSMTSALFQVGANTIFYLLEDIPDPSLPIPLFDARLGIAVRNIKITSLDHYFYINRQNYDRTNETTAGQIRLFRNVLTNFPSSHKADFQPHLINNFIGELADWIDTDNDVIQANSLIGREDYSSNSLPRIEPKNAPLDLIAELWLLPSFQGLNLLEPEQSVFDLPLRITDVQIDGSCYIGPLNLNMIKPHYDEVRDAIIQYAKWSEGVSLQDCGYRELHDNSLRLAESIADFIEEKKLPPYRVPLKDDSNWQQQLAFLGVRQISTKLAGLFSSRSKLLEVSFELLTESKLVENRVHLLLDYLNDEAFTPSNIKIVYFGHQDKYY